MFDNLPGNLQDMLAQAQSLQQDLLKAKSEAEHKTVQASSGGGMVTAIVNGSGVLLNLDIAREVINPDDKEMLQDLIKAAVNEAGRKAKEQLQVAMSQASGGLPIGGLF